jgi:hypothetical protein
MKKECGLGQTKPKKEEEEILPLYREEKSDVENFRSEDNPNWNRTRSERKRGGKKNLDGNFTFTSLYNIYIYINYIYIYY